MRDHPSLRAEKDQVAIAKSFPADRGANFILLFHGSGEFGTIELPKYLRCKPAAIQTVIIAGCSRIGPPQITLYYGSQIEQPTGRNLLEFVRLIGRSIRPFSFGISSFGRRGLTRPIPGSGNTTGQKCQSKEYDQQASQLTKPRIYNIKSFSII